MKTKTVVSMGLSRDNNNNVNILISDNHSGDCITELKMSLKELGLLVTGLHGVKAEATIYPESHIAKSREVKDVFCDKAPFNVDRKQLQRELVLQHFTDSGLGNEGWLLHNDGTSIQQPSDKHKYTVKKYVDVRDPLEVERYY